MYKEYRDTTLTSAVGQLYSRWRLVTAPVTEAFKSFVLALLRIRTSNGNRLCNSLVITSSFLCRTADHDQPRGTRAPSLQRSPVLSYFKCDEHVSQMHLTMINNDG